MWNMENFENQMQQEDRPDFKAEIVIDHRIRGAKRENFVNPYIRRLVDELPAVIVGIAAVVGCFIGYRAYRHNYKDSANSVASSIVNAIVIVVLGETYKYVAKFLATWENHRYNEDWESSFATKNYSFQFVNAYIALFDIAFSERKFNLLA